LKGWSWLTSTPETLDPLQFAFCTNRSTDDAISIALHTALSYLDKRNTYVRMLFIDYSSTFNTIVASKLITKLRTLGLNTSLRNWILDNTSATLILNTLILNTAYREVRDLTMWCKANNLSLNVIKTKEMIVDYRKRRTEYASIRIDGAVVE
jgi:gmma-aminobutyric acid receptor subunit gamma/cGMP-dependent protein kinase 2